MDLYVTIRAIGVLGVQVVLRASWSFCADAVRNTVTGQTKLGHPAGGQQPWIRRAVWCMTCDAPFGFHRGMFVNKGTLLVRMTLNTSRIGAGCESCLFQFKTAVRVMTITALHGALKNFVMERQIKLVLHLGVAAQAKLWLAVFQKFDGREARLFGVCRRYESDRAGNILSAGAAMGGVAICTTYVVAPVFTAPEVIVLLSSGVACKTRLGCFFG